MAKVIERDERGRWKKGSSGNPKGKTRELPAEFLADFQKGAPKALKKLKELMNSEDENVRLQAVRYYLDRCVGSRFRAFIDDEETTNDDLTIRVISADDKGR